MKNGMINPEIMPKELKLLRTHMEYDFKFQL